MNSNDILSIKVPSKLFGKDKIKAKAEYYRLLKVWHPDLNKEKYATDVASHIFDLWKHYENETEIPFITKKHDIGLCKIFEEKIEYEINNSISKHIPDIVSLINKIKYKDVKQKEEFSRYFPNPAKIIQLESKIIIPKPKDVVSLDDALLFFKNGIDPKHVAWIINGVINNICFLHLTQDLSFNGITTDNVFICPEHHTVLFIGGWWHTTKLDEKPKILPKSIHSRGYENCDLKSIYTLGLKLLGDENGTSLWKNVNIPKDIISFLMSYQYIQDPVKLFKEWEKVLVKSFGTRKFIKMDLTEDKFYTSGGK